MKTLRRINLTMFKNLTFFLFTLALSVSFKGFSTSLPEPVSNNAVALVTISEANSKQTHLISFMGLAENKEWKDVHNRVWSLNINTENQDKENPKWVEQSPVPSSLPLKGRLASVAAGIKDKAYLFGGYTVAEDHAEISSPDNFVYDLKTDSYQAIAATPVATDDAVALAYQDRYIYLISGWHNDGNVNLVQVYDVHLNRWQQASPFLGAPVFGHAGGIVDNQMLVCDGVKVIAQQDKRRNFAAEPACYSGTIDPNNVYKIDWRLIPHPTGKARYRMASAGGKFQLLLSGKNTNTSGILFMGGSSNPYNYNGMGYDGKPSEPSAKVWFYEMSSKRWWFTESKTATMDHRGLLVSSDISSNQTAYIVGGMEEKQQVSKQLFSIPLQSLNFEN